VSDLNLRGGGIHPLKKFQKMLIVKRFNFIFRIFSVETRLKALTGKGFSKLSPLKSITETVQTGKQKLQKVEF